MNAQTIAAFRNPPHRWRTMAWLTLAIVAAIAGWLQPQLLDPASWGDWLSDPGPLAWAALLALQCLAAVLMIPSLPMVVASAVLFPEHPGWVWLLALSGVVFSALLIHRNAAWMGLDHGWQRVPGGGRARRWLFDHGSPALCLWCMTPFLPSDLGCYVAAASKMPLKRYLPAVVLGESVLCGSVILGVGWVL